MTLKEARTILTKELNNVYEEDELKNIIDLVLEYITGLPKIEHVRNKIPYLTCTQLEDLDSITERLKNNEPVQYVLGEAWFAGVKFKVNKNVLIPRPETEELVDWVVKESQKSKVKSQKLLDVGTGSACIPITLKKKLPDADVSAIDDCDDALFIAAENAIEHNTEINFILFDFLQEGKWNELGNFDIVVSNPPYIREAEKNAMHERVTSFEPHGALFVADDDALLFYRKLSGFALKHLNAHGSLFVEINEIFGNEVVSLFESAGFRDVQLRKDMQGKDRMVKADI
jgi:release factor glutamine methyltransferase